jgi:hypothetical protein
LKDITVAIEGGQSRLCELRIAPGARPRDLLTAIGAWGALAAASRPAPFDLDDDLYEAVDAGDCLVISQPHQGTTQEEKSPCGRPARPVRGGSNDGR